MDAKITMSFDEDVVTQAKKFAEEKGIVLSRLTEYLFKRITTLPKNYASLDDIPVADFIWELQELQEEYVRTKKRTSKELKEMFYESKVSKKNSSKIDQ